MGNDMLRWYKDRFAEMRLEIKRLLNSEAKYLDSGLTEEATSGRDLYTRYHAFRDKLREEFPHEANHIPKSSYTTDSIGGLRRDDLKSLDCDIKALEVVLQNNSHV